MPYTFLLIPYALCLMPYTFLLIPYTLRLMPFPRIHCDLRLGPGAQFALAPEAAQHVAKSLRLKTGDSLTVFDGRGGEYEAVIQRVERDRVVVKLGAWHDTGWWQCRLGDAPANPEPPRPLASLGLGVLDEL